MRISTQQSRFSNRALWLVFVTVLAVGAAVAPFRVVAQQSAAAARPAPASAAEDAARPEAGQSKQEQQDNAFRLNSPLVKASARALHLDVETTARIYEFINFAILVLAIGIPLVRWLPGTIRKRAEKVRTDIESARKVTEDANARLSAVEAKLEKIDEEIGKFRAEVERESLEDEARIKAALEEESARIVVAAEQEIGAAVAQARRGLRKFAADLAVEQAAKQMILTAETDRALIAEFVGDVGKGGKN